MLKMSFYDGSLNRNKAKEFVTETNKPLRYTYGLSFRNPTTHNKPITKEEALKIIDDQSLLHITEKEEYVHLNAYSENDMW
jgi:hypothetical protein